MSRGKKYRAVSEKRDASKRYSVEEAIAFLKGNALAKFDEAVEAHIHLGINAKKSDESVRASVVLPHGTGRQKKVAVVTSISTKEAEAREAKADLVGGVEIIAGIKEGKIIPGQAFDVLIATPEVMPKLAPIAKILGPKGLMPSPKNETVTQKIKETVAMLKQGKKITFKNDDTGNIHQIIGRLSFSPEKLAENYQVFREALEKAKPAASKGKLVESVTLCSTMGPGLRIAL